MIKELNENPLNIKWNITETQVNNHWNLNEIWRRTKWTFTECSEKYYGKGKKNNAMVDKKALAENVRNKEGGTTIIKWWLILRKKYIRVRHKKDHVD